MYSAINTGAQTRRAEHRVFFCDRLVLSGLCKEQWWNKEPENDTEIKKKRWTLRYHKQERVCVCVQGYDEATFYNVKTSKWIPLCYRSSLRGWSVRNPIYAISPFQFQRRVWWFEFVSNSVLIWWLFTFNNSYVTLCIVSLAHQKMYSNSMLYFLQVFPWTPIWAWVGVLAAFTVYLSLPDKDSRRMYKSIWDFLSHNT